MSNEIPQKNSGPASAAAKTTTAGAASVASFAALTRQQRDQLFEQAAKGMVPKRRKAEPDDPLREWWPQIKRKLSEGYSVRQVQDILASPSIGLTVSARAVQRIIKAHTAAAKTTAAATVGKATG